ncbi:MAG: DUF2321 domain-containing protein [Spirochaetia bacterium]|nr:DUF2321 domain-containing protein [Spirochaetia bacterium]
MSVAAQKIIEELDELSTEDKEYVKEVFDKMLIEARREEIYQNIQLSEQEYKERKTKSFDNANDLMSSLNED